MGEVILRGKQPAAGSFGYGYGIFDGSGSGDGYGYGSGDGSGYGYGYGSEGVNGGGRGDGYGYKDYWLACIHYFAKKWLAEQQKRFAEVTEAGLQLAFWRSHTNGLPSNGGGRIEPAAPGVIHTAPGPLNLCKAGTLHATLLPSKWNGERWWIVALHGEVIGDEEKYGCLKREILGEAI
jgi:hypothetical protein